MRGDETLVSVVLCTTATRPTLRDCLRSLSALDDARHEVIIVDNGPTPVLPVGDFAAQGMRVVHEPRRGLDAARNRGIREAQGAIVAFVDDDCIVDRSWLAGIRRAFADPDVAFVAGRTPAWSLARRSEQCFERMFSFDRAEQPRSFDLDTPDPFLRVCPGAIGTGCNMAFRRTALVEIGGFDEALDMGTLIAGGGDLDMFARLLREGHAARYCPDAIVHHRHRTTMSDLAWQVWGYALCQGAIAAKAWWHDKASRTQARRFIRYRLRNATHRGLRGVLRREPVPPHLSAIEFVGILAGVVLFPVASWRSRRQRRAFATPQPGDETGTAPEPLPLASPLASA